MSTLSKCPDCNTDVSTKATTCPNCGAPLSSGKSRTTAALLAFFLGGVGGHRFYLGQVGWGVGMLLFCWTFIPVIIAVVDLVRYLSMDDRDFAEAYG